MTADHVPVDDPEVLRHILATTDALLLDFDGPVCAIFANLPAHYVASQLRDVLAEGGHTELPEGVKKTDDPFDVLTYAATLGTDEARYVEAALRAHEVEAATSAPATPGADELIQAWGATGRKLAIVSNNSGKAVKSYIHVHRMTIAVDYVSARMSADLRKLKPNAHLVTQAVEQLDVKPSQALLIGDSATDIDAAHNAGVRSVGFANKLAKATLLAEKNPSALITDMQQILDAL